MHSPAEVWKTQRTTRGVRVSHHGHVLSEVLSQPGATHSVFDLLAAGAAVLAPKAERLAMLGFAAGGLMAPLRKMNVDAHVDAVDLSAQGVPIFQKLAAGWGGRWAFHHADAVDWLGSAGRYDLIIEDLSQQIPGDVIKPVVSLETLPPLISRHTDFVVINALPTPGWTWAVLMEWLTAPYPHVSWVSLKDFQNRVLLAGTVMPGNLTRALRTALEAVGSNQSDRFSVRHLR